MAVSRSRGHRTSFQRPVGSRVWLFQGYRRLAGLGVQGQGAPHQSPTSLWAPVWASSSAMQNKFLLLLVPSMAVTLPCLGYVRFPQVYRGGRQGRYGCEAGAGALISVALPFFLQCSSALRSFLSSPSLVSPTGLNFSTHRFFFKFIFMRVSVQARHQCCQ